MSDSESDAPEEFTSQQGVLQDEEIRRVQKENKSRVVREGKERRKQWAQRKTPRSSEGDESAQGAVETEMEEGNEIEEEEPHGNKGMLPRDIVLLLAAREKKVFSSDSEDEKVKIKAHSQKKKRKHSGPETVIVKNIPPPKCIQNSLEFFKRKKMQVPRSYAVLNNSNQALRLISSSGLLGKK